MYVCMYVTAISAFCYSLEIAASLACSNIDTWFIMLEQELVLISKGFFKTIDNKN